MKGAGLNPGALRAGLTMMTSLLIVISALVVACGAIAPGPPVEGDTVITLSSPAFQDGEAIPVRYTCEGEDISPLLNWSEPPQGTKALAIIMLDPDAPDILDDPNKTDAGLTHWLLFNLPADIRQLSEAVPIQEELSDGALHGTNDFGRTGYGGPCPSDGSAHRYTFTIYALDEPLDLLAGVSKGWVLHAMQGHILARGELKGTFKG